MRNLGRYMTRIFVIYTVRQVVREVKSMKLRRAGPAARIKSNKRREFNG